MWSRSELKSRAKAVLSDHYWMAFLVSLVIFLAGGRGGGNGGRSDSGSGTIRNPLTGNTIIDNDTVASVVSFIVPLAFGALILIVSMRIFLGYPLEVGGRRFFIKCSRYEDHRGCFRFAFHSDHYIRIIAAMLVRSVLVFLWSLLLVIPGIVMSYAYSMVPYLMAENPGMGYRRALELSKAMTWGHKLDMFVLDLSFIGWYLLGALALGLGAFFVFPYDNATKAELYQVLKQEALKKGLCGAHEFLIVW
jgi:uncharacterized membrane protein